VEATLIALEMYVMLCNIAVTLAIEMSQGCWGCAVVLVKCVCAQPVLWTQISVHDIGQIEIDRYRGKDRQHWADVLICNMGKTCQEALVTTICECIWPNERDYDRDGICIV